MKVVKVYCDLCNSEVEKGKIRTIAFYKETGVISFDICERHFTEIMKFTEDLKNDQCQKDINGCANCKTKCSSCKFSVLPCYDVQNDEMYDGYCKLGLTSCKNCKLFEPRGKL